MEAKLTGDPIPALSGDNFNYPANGVDAMRGIGQLVNRERENCTNPECALMPFLQVSIEKRAVSAGALCTNTCSRLPRLVADINSQI